MFFTSIKEINSLWEEIRRLLSKGMLLDIYLKVTIEKKFEKIRLWVSFWGAITHADIIDFSNFLLQLKNQRSGNKTTRGFSIIFILREL